MKAQLDLFAWADARLSNVVDAMPALIRKAALETMRAPPCAPREVGEIILMERKEVA
jgi:hypothetical protein